jgi:hypothetical protein
MGLVALLKMVFASRSGKRLEASAPTAEFPHQVDAIEHVISNIEQNRYATFVANNGSRDLIIQATPDSINTCKENVDAAEIARKIGLSAIAELIEESRSIKRDHTTHHVPNASARELAELVNAIYIHHYRLSAQYSIEARLGDY